MSREIKFRVWDGGWFPRNNIAIVDGEFYIYLGGRCDPLMALTEEGAVCQYTGLKDKNGVEIYEGDIIVPYYDSSGDVEIVRQGDIEKYGRDELWYSSEEVRTVIGNIYENPELIGAK